MKQYAEIIRIEKDGYDSERATEFVDVRIDEFPKGAKVLITMQEINP